MHDLKGIPMRGESKHLHIWLDNGDAITNGKIKKIKNLDFSAFYVGTTHKLFTSHILTTHQVCHLEGSVGLTGTYNTPWRVP